MLTSNKQIGFASASLRAFGLALATLVVPWASTAHAQASVFKGAGSSAAALVYQGWGKEYLQVSGAALTYDPAGSSAGVKKIKAKEVDFGATDVAPKAEDLAADGLVLIPIAITGIAPVFNMPQFNEQPLLLTGDVLAKIFLAEISRWDHPEIKALNPGRRMPNTAIKVVVRADGSGTSYNFGDYLNKVSDTWKTKMGAKNTYTWPAEFIQVKGSQAIAKTVRETPGSIGYVDFGYVKEASLAVAQIKNAHGAFVAASSEAFRSALLNSDWVHKGSFTTTLTNKPGRESWPLTMGTFALLPKVISNADQAKTTVNYFTWALLKGDNIVREYNFVRLPDNVQASAFKALMTIRDKNGQSIAVNLQ